MRWIACLWIRLWWLSLKECDWIVMNLAAFDWSVLSWIGLNWLDFNSVCLELRLFGHELTWIQSYWMLLNRIDTDWHDLRWIGLNRIGSTWLDLHLLELEWSELWSQLHWIAFGAALVWLGLNVESNSTGFDELGLNRFQPHWFVLNCNDLACIHLI